MFFLPTAFGRPATGLTLVVAAAALVCLPVFAEAPLVRVCPWAAVGAGLGLWAAGRAWRHHPWGQLLLGLATCWLAGSAYWGWLRAEPTWHLPVESLPLLWLWPRLWRNQWGLAEGFFLGSLLGTAITDGYFYLTGLVPIWRTLMGLEGDILAVIAQGQPLLQQAVTQVLTPWGLGWAALLGAGLVALGGWAYGRPGDRWKALTGAVWGTLIVDGLFWVSTLPTR
ncbi:MAG: DUF3120 domain-containing protein [Gloeomargaritaceae cyanobacterium C42_A2020_066]|nr:DUF3120 domain-containing protein [Gloeomargaritaceae cyanobacterium C42_A2020_066]